MNVRKKLGGISRNPTPKRLPPATNRPLEPWPPAGKIEVITFQAHKDIKDSLGEPAWQISAARSFAMEYQRLANVLYSLSLITNEGFTNLVPKVSVRGFCGSEFSLFYSINASQVKRLVTGSEGPAVERDFFFRVDDGGQVLLRVKDADSFLKFLRTAKLERLALTPASRREERASKRKIAVEEEPVGKEDIVEEITKGKKK